MERFQSNVGKKHCHLTKKIKAPQEMKEVQKFVLQFTIIYFQFIRKRHLGGEFFIYDVNRMSTSKNQKVSKTFGTTLVI